MRRSLSLSVGRSQCIRAAMASTTFSASRPTPRTVTTTWRRGRAGRRNRVPARWPRCRARASALWSREDGEVDPREVRAEPRAPDDVGHLEDPLSSSRGQPVPHADGAGDALDAGRGDVRGLDPDERRALSEHLRAHLAADRRPTVSTWWPTNRTQGAPRGSAPPPSMRKGHMGLTPGEPRRCALGATSRAISAPELPVPTTRTPPFWSCDGFRYSPACSWTMPGSSSRANGGTQGPGARHRHHHVVRLEAPIARRHDESVPAPREPVNPDAGSHRQREPGRVGREVVRHLVLGGERVGGAGKGIPGSPS